MLSPSLTYIFCLPKIILNEDAFLIVGEGCCEIQAILPTYRKKTAHIRQFLCKKQKGDMLYLPSIKNLIRQSSKNDFTDRRSTETDNKKRRLSQRKINIIDIIDTISVKSISDLKMLLLDRTKFERMFDQIRSDRSSVDVQMLKAIMKTNLSDYLLQLPFLEGIPYSKLETLVRMCHYQVQHEGSIICKEGDSSTDVYFILSGEVHVEAQASKHVVNRFNSSATIEKSRKESVSRLLQCRRGSSISLDPSDTAFAHQYFFPSANEYEVVDDFLEEDEDSPHSESFVSKKSAPICRHFTTLSDIELARLGPGEYFGIMSTITGLPRSATVTAISNVLLASISKTDFNSFIKVSPSLAPTVEQMAKGHMLLNLFQLKSPFLSQISFRQAKRIGEKCSIQKFNKGNTLFRQGEVCYVYLHTYY